MPTTELFLVPTPLEWRSLQPLLSPTLLQQTWRLCGFGPVAAAASTMHWLHELQPTQVTLVGIAGGYLDHNPIGSAVTFDQVLMQDIGAWQDNKLLTATDLGFPMWTGESCQPTSVNSQEPTRDSTHPLSQPLPPTLDLTPAPQLNTGGLLTVSAASGSTNMARDRAAQSQAIAEDMEGYSVAMACRMIGCPLTIVRGLSNQAGDRNIAHWKIAEALQAAAAAINNR